MSFTRSLRDVFLIAQFEVLRAIRTWQALALIVLYMVSIVGFTLMFVGMLWILEFELAKTLGVPPTEYPGAMTQKLVERGGLREGLIYMLENEARVDQMLTHPILAIFFAWIGMRVTPFLAAMTSSECISVDMRSRALRFEVLRTGRLELVTGRFVGQAMLAGVATFVGSIGVWLVGMLLMVGNDPLHLASSLLILSVRVWAFSLPFVGLGCAASQLTSSPAWARVMAVAGTAATWILYLVVYRYSDWKVPWLWDVVLQAMPYDWRELMWDPGIGWTSASAICLAMGLALVSVGYLRFARRDL